MKPIKTAENNRKRSRIRGLICLAGFLFGLSVLFYPTVANYWNLYRQRQLTGDYEKQILEKDNNGALPFEDEWARARAYDESLQPIRLPDSFAAAEERDGEDQTYLDCLNVNGNGMMGTVEIPGIHITLPIMHTTAEDVLQNAAGHLEGSSLPIGGNGTHCVIAAHRGLPSAALFTDLDTMQMGDHFYLHILNETLAYEVETISVVEPEDTSQLGVQEGRDLCTLLTCTPYGVNTQRLLVTGHRVKYDETDATDESPGSVLGISSHTSYLLWSLGGLAVTLLFVWIFMHFSGRRHNSGAKRT